MIKKCCICNRPVFTAKSIYCLRCHKFAYCMKNRRINGNAAGAIWNWVKKHGYVCFYTGVDLDLDNRASPQYFEFDHEIPGNGRTIRLTCTLFNEVKSDLALNELKDYVHQLDRHWTTGAKVRIRKLKYWYRLRPPLFKK